MRDIPVFTTEYGIASLLLKEIPYRQTAYIRIRTVQPGQEHLLLQECAGFCRMAGAERIYASWEEGLEGMPLAVSILQMQGTCCPDENLTANLFPVTGETVGCWREICNKAMRAVDNSATLEGQDEQMLVDSAGTYFVHENGKLLGIGWIEDGQLKAIAAVEKGAGKRVMHTLMTLTPGETLTLEVASTNQKAIRLYESLGFVTTRELSRWYCL